LWRSGSAMGP